MFIFLSPCGLCSRSLCTSPCGGEKYTFFRIQSNMKSVNLGTLPVFNFYHQTPCDFFSYLFAWKHDRTYMEKKRKWKNCMEMWKKLKENDKRKWKSAECDWKNERINMAKIWTSEKNAWKREGFIKKQWKISMEKWRIRVDKRKNLYGPTVF